MISASPVTIPETLAGHKPHKGFFSGEWETRDPQTLSETIADSENVKKREPWKKVGACVI